MHRTPRQKTTAQGNTSERRVGTQTDTIRDDIEKLIDDFLRELGKLAIYARDQDADPWEPSVAVVGHGLKQKLLNDIETRIDECYSEGRN